MLWGRLLLHRSLERSVFWIKMLKDCFAHSASAFDSLDAFMATFTGMTSRYEGHVQYKACISKPTDPSNRGIFQSRTLVSIRACSRTTCLNAQSFHVLDIRWCFQPTVSQTSYQSMIACNRNIMNRKNMQSSCIVLSWYASSVKEVTMKRKRMVDHGASGQATRARPVRQDRTVNVASVPMNRKEHWIVCKHVL